jgi:hypothetical protein
MYNSFNINKSNNFEYILVNKKIGTLHYRFSSFSNNIE